jgi:hypothetical protein
VFFHAIILNEKEVDVMIDIHSKVYNFLQEVEAHQGMRLISFTLASKTATLFDFKKEPYLVNGKQLVFSVTKSFTSLAIGMIYDQGLIDLDGQITKYFKDEMPKDMDPLMHDITVRHLLTMTSGVVHENNKEMFKTNDFRMYFLCQKVQYKPGTHYQYHSATSHMLSAIFSKITGKTVETYLKENLFIPLDITNYHWSSANEGISFGGYGLSINNDAMVKIGQLLLNGGVYRGRRYISKTYLDMATSPQSVKQDYVDNPNAKAIGYQYGFQFHVSPNGSYRADGAYGQIILIYNDLAFISTAQYTDYEMLFHLIYKHFTADAVIPIQLDVLTKKLETLTFKQAPSVNTFEINQTFEFEANPLAIKTLEFSNDYLLMTFSNGQTDHIHFNYAQDQYGESSYVKDLALVKQPHWVIPTYKNKELKLRILYVETPFFADYIFNFENEQLKFTFVPGPNFLVNGFTVVSK